VVVTKPRRSREGGQLPEHTAKSLAIWEEIRDQVARRIAALVQKISRNLPKDKTLARFRTTRPIPRQFYEILEERANAWVSEVHKLCLEAQNCPNDSETDDVRQAMFDFVIDPLIDEQLADLLLRAAGFEALERQLAKRGDRELRAYMPERYASLKATASGCREVKEKVRSRWMQELSGRSPSNREAEVVRVLTKPKPEQRFVPSSDYRSLDWNGEQYTLTPQQAHAVRIWHEHHQSGTPDIGDAYVLEELGTATSRLRDTFRGSPLWGTLIISKRRGTHRLSISSGS
jgi:hypothetical protein